MIKVEFPIRDVDEDAFRALRDGSKNIEVRAGGPKYDGITVGDIAVFTFGDERLERRVLWVQNVGSLDELLDAYSVQSLTPWLDSKEEYVRRMNGFPGYPERIARYGLIVIALEE